MLISPARSVDFLFFLSYNPLVFAEGSTYCVHVVFPHSQLLVGTNTKIYNEANKKLAELQEHIQIKTKTEETATSK